MHKLLQLHPGQAPTPARQKATSSLLPHHDKEQKQRWGQLWSGQTNLHSRAALGDPLDRMYFLSVLKLRPAQTILLSSPHQEDALSLLPTGPWTARGHRCPTAGRYKLASSSCMGVWSSEALVPFVSLASQRRPTITSGRLEMRVWALPTPSVGVGTQDLGECPACPMVKSQLRNVTLACGPWGRPFFFFTAFLQFIFFCSLFYAHMYCFRLISILL